jgi:hypothetical protein
MTIHSQDHQGGSLQDLGGQEATQWTHLSATLGLSEYPPSRNTTVTFTWDNKGFDAFALSTSVPRLKRLDRFYVSTTLKTVCPSASVVIHATQVIFDLSLVSVHVASISKS